MAGAVLVVDDDLDVQHAARLALGREAARVETLGAAEAIETRLDGGDFEVVLLDMNFTPGDQSGRVGLSALERIRAHDPSLSVVLMTAFGGVSLAVEALKQGAADFVLKPWRNAALTASVEAAAELTRRKRQADASFDLEAVERHAIQRALAHYEGNIQRAAAALGLTRQALYRRMERHGL